MNEFLNGMEQRILLGYCADSILNRRKRNTEIEGWFPEEGELDHMFYDLLLFIMEYSLSEAGGCTLSEISSFLSEDLRQYAVSLTAEQTDQLASYMVKDILQNGGSVLSYPVFYHERGQWGEAVVRLIEDRLSEDRMLVYKLSEQGYDFLLRTKEIDNQFEGWVSMLIAKQQLERRNYRESYKQARQSLQILRKQETAFDAFIQSIRRDLHSVENDAYSKMIDTFYENLQLEQQMTEETIRVVKEYRRELSSQKERLLEQEDKTLEESLGYLKGMAELLETITETENRLLNNRYSVRKIFEQLIEASLTASVSSRHYDYYETLIHPAGEMHDPQFLQYLYLRRPLLEPRMDKTMNLGLLYAPEKNLDREADDPDYIALSEEEEENLRLKEKAERMERTQSAFLQFLRYAESHPIFRIRDFVHACNKEAEENNEPYLSDHKSFYLMFLDLYAQGTMDLTEEDLTDVRYDDSAEEFDFRQMMKRMKSEGFRTDVKTITLNTAEGIDIFTAYTSMDTLEYGMDSLEAVITYRKKDRT